MRTLPHPDRDQIDVANVLDALSDPTRLAIVVTLAHRPADAPELRCGSFDELGSKSNLTYHFAKLREAGVTRSRLDGTLRYISLRRDDLDLLFPGLLDAIIRAAEKRNGLVGLLPADEFSDP
jgi:DNA-binding transcriptional ArsR family regulator